MFPSNDRYKMFDDYGEILVPSEFAFEFQMDIDKVLFFFALIFS